MLKDLEVHLDINSEKRELITTSAIFYSRDINTSKILIHITRKNKEISLSPEAKVYVLMLFDEGRETKKHLYAANFEEKSIYSIVLPEKVLGYEGIVTAGVYIDYQNEQSADAGYFSFHMKRSMLDDDFPELDTVYISEFEKALNEIKEKSAEFDDEAQRLTEKIIAIENKIDSNQVVKKDDFDTKVEQVEIDIKNNADQIDELAINHLNDNKKLNNEIMRMSRPAEKSVKYIAHRGNHAQYPENSLGSFNSVRSHWGIESDIQITKDGHWVIMHDATVDRTTNGTGRVDSMTLEEIRNLKLNYSAAWTNKDGKIPRGWEKVPLFEEYLTCCKNKAKIPIIEIKKGPYTDKNYDDLVEIVKQNMSNLDNIVFMSFDYDVLLELRKRMDTAFVAYLANDVSKEVVDKVNNDFKFRCGVNIKYSSKSVNEDIIKYTHAKKMMFGVWTVPENEFETMNELGVDLITTDSQSSQLRHGKASVRKPFVERLSPYVESNNIIEQENGSISLKLLVVEGTNNPGDLIATIPEWAIPVKDVWGSAIIRTSGGVELGTVDISGRLYNATSDTSYPGSINVGQGWTNRANWANIEMTYDLY